MPSRIARGALLFVLVSLCALVLVPLLVQRQVDRVRSSVEDVASPARTWVTSLQFSLSREMSALRGFLLTGAEEYLDVYTTAVGRELQTFAELEPLMIGLGPEVLRHFVEVRTLSGQWHARVDEDSIVWRREASPQYLATIATEQELFENILQASTELDAAIAQRADQSRAEIRSLERFGLGLTVLMGVLAFASAVVVGWMELRMRRIAEESERRKTIAEEAAAELGRASESRARLIRGVTHDVKNPLGAAIGYVQLLELGVRGNLTESQAKLVAGIRRSLDGAVTILADLLDLARANSGSLSVRLLPTNLDSLLGRVVEDHRGAAEAVGIHIHYTPPPDLIELKTDSVRVTQVLGNVLTNAIKYTPPPGEVYVHTEEVSAVATPEIRWVAVRVRDSGPGIPADMREIIFEEFTRLHEEGGPQGHGLGLSISRSIARMLGGDLTLDEVDGDGASFTLWLPASEAAAGRGESPPLLPSARPS